MGDNRVKSILKASFIAIGINALLGVFKAIVGLLTHSIAISMDAVNNFTDAGSSLITIISAHFSSKKADKKHPFGYGRTEYLGTLLIAGLILYAGITAFVESVKLIIHPEEPEYSTVSLIIVGVAIVLKLILTMYIVAIGKKVKSDSLIASGKESIGDVAVSIATIVAAFIFIFTGVALEAWLGAIIAIMIIKAGLETLKETVDKILGNGAEVQLVKDIKKTIAAHDEVNGAYDLILHNYGPDSYMATVHIEVSDTMLMNEYDTLTRNIQEEILEKFGIYLSAVGVYSVNNSDAEIVEIRNKVKELAMQDEMIHQVHGFFADKNSKQMRFDLVISFEAKDRNEVYNKAIERIKLAYPEYEIQAGLDADFNEL